MQFKYYLDNNRNREGAVEELHRFADIGERVILTAFTEPALVEPVAILLAGGLDKIDQGMDGMAHLWRMFIGEYLQRCARAGFERRERCKLPLDFPWRQG
jgi:hypothetical protein